MPLVAMAAKGTRIASALSSLEAQSKWLAQQRKQRPTTAHVLLALFQRGTASEVFAAAGVSELAMLDAVRGAGAEPDPSFSLVRERAERLALSFGAQEPSDLHVLCVLVREVRSAAFRMLHSMHASASGLELAVLHVLRASAASHVDPNKQMASRGRIQDSATAEAPGARGQERASRLGAARPWAQRRRPLPSAQQQLAVETEQRRARIRKDSGPGSEPLEAQTDLAELQSIITDSASDERSGAPHARAGSRHASVQAALARAAVSRTSLASALELDAKRFPLLTSLGRNLSLAAARGEIDPVIGRDAEVEQVLDVLSRRRARNPVLVGAPGVGKTSVVDGVARALVQAGETRVVIEIPTSALLSGTGVRGALAERIEGLLREIVAAERRVILFLDEAHTVLGTDDGADSVAGSLKTALARGDVACIAATTDQEHRRIFERDAALARRFTRIEVQEPSRDSTLEILRGIAPEYERHHGVRIDEQALVSAVDLSVRFMSERRLPDKAIGLLDQAAARVKRRAGREVGASAVAEAVSEHCGVPLDRLMMRDGELLLGLEAFLQSRVVGQEHVASAISDALRKGAAGFRGKRPLCTLLLLGPTGVGKTEMAKAIAERMFPGTAMTRIDMSELSEAHGVARLLGAPPGYIGHEDGGQLTEAIRKRPYQLVLLDEVEKAHRDVLLALLPLLDEGRLTDGRGRTIDFTNAVIVMTSNLGVEALISKRSVGFEQENPAQAREHRTLMLRAAQRALAPELWNRIDEPLCFDALDRNHIERIARMFVAQVAQLAKREHGIALEVDEDAIELLVQVGYDPALGARPMRRAVSRLVEAPLARAVLALEAKRGDAVRLSRCDNATRLILHDAVVDAAE